ncbi:MAG: hypothetical protein K2N36_03135 [Ruminiclostridium sp.]|nr:hypothetical protein [Ruminiclostridium sp.]
MKWEEMFSGKSFITDLGEKQTVEKDGKKIELGQYAVWVPFNGDSHHKIVDVGEDLPALMKKYNISPERICILQQ